MIYVFRMDDTKTVLVDIVGKDLDFLVDRLKGIQLFKCSAATKRWKVSCVMS